MWHGSGVAETSSEWTDVMLCQQYCKLGIVGSLLCSAAMVYQVQVACVWQGSFNHAGCILHT